MIVPGLQEWIKTTKKKLTGRNDDGNEVDYEEVNWDKATIQDSIHASDTMMMTMMMMMKIPLLTMQEWDHNNKSKMNCQILLTILMMRANKLQVTKSPTQTLSNTMSQNNKSTILPLWTRAVSN
jgi:hypothetical protein